MLINYFVQVDWFHCKEKRKTCFFHFLSGSLFFVIESNERRNRSFISSIEKMWNQRSNHSKTVAMIRLCVLQAMYVVSHILKFPLEKEAKIHRWILQHLPGTLWYHHRTRNKGRTNYSITVSDFPFVTRKDKFLICKKRFN